MSGVIIIPPIHKASEVKDGNFLPTISSKVKFLNSKTHQ